MPKDIKELRAKLAAVKKSGAEKLAAYNGLVEKESRTAEEDARLVALDTEIEGLETEAASLAGEVEASEKAARRASAFGAGGQPPAPQPGRMPRAQVTGHNIDPTGGFATLAEFASCVQQAQINHSPSAIQRLSAAAADGAAVSGGDAGEGFLVPAQYRQEIWELVFSGPDLLTMVTPEPTALPSVTIPKDETTPWGASGVKAYWRVEASQMQRTKPATTGETVHLHELYAFVVAGSELLADAPRLQSRLTSKAAAAIRFAASEAILWGDGVGKPLGVMKSSALVTVAKETGQAADTIVPKNLLKMYSRLLASGSGSVVWLANTEILPELGTLTIGDNLVWTPPASGFVNAPGGYLLGRPVLFTEHAKALGDLGDLVLFDPAGYYAINKAGGGIDFADSIHLFFDYNMQAFRWTFRYGGQPFLSAPVSPQNGSLTKSHFVALAERA